LSGCGSSVPSTLTGETKKEADQYLKEYGKNAIVHYLQKEQGDGIDKRDIESLVSQGADVNAKTDGGYTPLHFTAVADENVEIVKFLVSQGADINVKTDTGSTPLHVAAVNGGVEIVKFLVAQGADVNAKNKVGTPLDMAKQNENTVVVEYLSGLK
jgi:ankyrin repeat protein